MRKRKTDEAQEYPQLTDEEMNVVYQVFGEASKNIQVLFRTNCKQFEKWYTDCVSILMPFALFVFQFTKKGFVLLSRIYLADLKTIIYSTEKGVLIQSEKNNLIFDSTESLQMAQRLYRNYMIIFSELPENESIEVTTDDESLFPPFKIPISQSQKFQFAYAALCAKKNVPFNQEAVRCVHSLSLCDKGILDISLLPTELYTKESNLEPIFSCVDYFGDISGFSCVGLNWPSLLHDLSPVLQKSSKLKVMHLINCHMKKGMEDVYTAIRHNRNIPLIYWCLEGNVFKDFEFFPRVLAIEAEPLKHLSLNNCKLTPEQCVLLFDAMATNPAMHSLKNLYIQGVEMNRDALSSFYTFLQESEQTIEALDLGSISGSNLSRHLISAINANPQPLQYLNLSNTKINKKGVDCLCELLSTTKTLETLDISYSGISIEDIDKIIETIYSNENIKLIDFGMSGTNLHGVNGLFIFRTLADERNYKWRELKFDSTSIDEEELQCLIVVLRTMENLESVSLSYNFSNKTPNIANVLLGLLDIPNLKRLTLRGDSKHRLRSALVAFLDSIAVSPIEEIDITGSGAGTEGFRSFARLIRKSSNLRKFACDDCGHVDFSVWSEFIDAAANCASLVDFVFPANDAKATVESSDREEKNAIQRKLSRVQTTMSLMTARHALNARINPALIGADKYAMRVIREAIGVSKSRKRTTKHSAVSEDFGLPLPFQSIGSRVLNGGSVEEIEIPTVYETPMAKLMVIEDTNAFIEDEDDAPSEVLGVTAGGLLIEDPTKGRFVSKRPEQPVSTNPAAAVDDRAWAKKRPEKIIKSNYSEQAKDNRLKTDSDVEPVKKRKSQRHDDHDSSDDYEKYARIPSKRKSGKSKANETTEDNYMSSKRSKHKERESYTKHHSKQKLHTKKPYDDYSSS